MNAWPQSSESGRIARVLAKSIHEHMGWPNDHFVAGDSMHGLLYDDDGGAMGIVRDMEDALEAARGTITESQWLGICETSFGRAVEALLKLKGVLPNGGASGPPANGSTI